MKISILGYGVFGSALGDVLSPKGHIIYKEEIKDSEVILMATPAYVLIEVLLSHKSEITDQKIIICSKGFDNNGELFSKVLQKEFPNNRVYFLYGPALADELKSGVFTVMVLAGGEGKEELKKQIEGGNLSIELSDDIVGVQVGAALKNTVAIFVGLVEGAGFGENTQAFVYAKGLEEIRKVGVHLGANPGTFLGLSCAGDLFLKSRNRSLGIEIGKGKSFEEISKQPIYPKEGVDTLNIVLKMENNINLDYFKLIHSIVYDKMPVEEAIKKLVGK
jgi:glycerol-3-phosphate dehydrogenase (NAD(P)+)